MSYTAVFKRPTPPWSTAASHPDQKGNPCCVYGDRGLGKSHRLHVTGHLIKAAHPRANILALSALSFATDVAEAAQSGGTDSLVRRFCSLDALLLDDIELLADDHRAQEALVAVLGDLLASGRRVVITSDRHPEEIPWLAPALQSHKATRVPARIDPPDLKGRVAILRRIGAECGVEMLPDAVAYFIARLPSAGGGVRELEHCLRRVLANADRIYRPARRFEPGQGGAQTRLRLPEMRSSTSVMEPTMIDGSVWGEERTPRKCRWMLKRLARRRVRPMTQSCESRLLDPPARIDYY